MVIKCENCGAPNAIEKDSGHRFCSYCGSPLKLTNENILERELHMQREFSETIIKQEKERADKAEEMVYKLAKENSKIASKNYKENPKIMAIRLLFKTLFFIAGSIMLLGTINMATNPRFETGPTQLSAAITVILYFVCFVLLRKRR